MSHHSWTYQELSMVHTIKLSLILQHTDFFDYFSLMRKYSQKIMKLPQVWQGQMVLGIGQDSLFKKLLMLTTTIVQLLLGAK